MMKMVCLLLGLLLLAFPALAQDESAQTDPPALIVGHVGVFLRDEPSPEMEAIAFPVSDVRLPITGISEDGNYYQVGYDGDTYWVPAGLEVDGDLSTILDPPAAAARAFFEVVFTGEGEITPLLCQSNAEAAEAIEQGMETLRQTLESNGAEVDISGMTFTTTRQTATAAQVEVGGTIKFTVAGTEQVMDYPTMPLPLWREEDGWKICG